MIFKNIVVTKYIRLITVRKKMSYYKSPHKDEISSLKHEAELREELINTMEEENNRLRVNISLFIILLIGRFK